MHCHDVVLSNHVIYNCEISFLLYSTVIPHSYLSRYVCIQHCLILYCYSINNDYAWYNICSTWFLNINNFFISTGCDGTYVIMCKQCQHIMFVLCLVFLHQREIGSCSFLPILICIHSIYYSCVHLCTGACLCSV